MQIKALEKLQRLASEPRGQVFLVVITLAVSLLIRLLLFNLNGCRFDEPLFAWWHNIAANQGLSGFYTATGCDQGSASCCDYPPFSVYIFRLFGWIAHAIGHDGFSNLGYVDKFLLRLPQNLFDLGTAYLIFRFLRPRYSFLFALGGMAVYALNPAVIFDLAVWGQMDSIYTFFMVASVYTAMRSRHELSGGLFALAILTKPQSVVLLPVLAYLILKNGGWKRALSSSAIFFTIIFLVILPFHWGNPVTFMYDRYMEGYSRFAYNSANAYNFWALAGFFKNDTVSHLGLGYQMWGVIAFIIFAAFVMWQFHRRPVGRAPVFAVFLLMFGFFMLMTRMHERYLFPVFALLALSFSPRYPPWLYIGLTATFFANLAYVLSNLNYVDPVTTLPHYVPDGHWSIYVLVPINAILFIYAIWSFWKMQHAKLPEAVPEAITRAPPEPRPPEIAPQELPSAPLEPKEPEEKPPSPPPPKVATPWSHALLLVLIIATYLGVSLWNLGDRSFPKSDWVVEWAPQDVVVDLGQTASVDNIFLLKQRITNTEIELFWGSPQSWTSAGNWQVGGAYQNHQWEGRSFGQETRYVRLMFISGSGRFGEIALYSNNQRLPINSVTVNGNETAGKPLFDEQDLLCSQLSSNCNPSSHKSGIYFDEEHYVKTAEETLKLQDPSQWDHPPTSKLLMAVGIAIFGHDPFGWRIMGVIFGALMLLLIYDFAKRIFNSSRAGLIAAFLLSFDFMHFAQARIATPEAFILLFIIAMFYFFYRYWQDPARGGKYLFLSLVFFGLGFSTKWHAMYGFVGIVLLLILLKWRKPIHRNEVLWFIGGCLAAVAVYMLSYVTYFLAGHDLKDFWDMQWRIFDFHRNLSQGHGSSSAWYTWPLMFRPVWFYAGYFSGVREYISSFGNPALWWAGIPIMLATLWMAVKYRNKVAIFIVIPFLTQWLFFVPITRVVFIYHFYPNVLFMILAAVFWIEWLWSRYKWGKWVALGYLLLNLACFVFFFPVISGYPMSNGYWDSLGWLVRWVTGGFGPH